MNYAMVLDGNVIDVLCDLDYFPIYPPTQLGLPIIAVECDLSVRVNMRYEDGVFEDRLAKAEELMHTATTAELAIMETQATIYEEMTASALASAEATAEIYEAILLIGGNA